MQKKLLQLFTSVLYISTFTFGGGFAIAALLKKEFVDRLHYIDEEEMIDLITISQACPGTAAVNASIMVGLKVGGIVGMFVAVLASILPPLLIISVISVLYKAFISNLYVATILKGMQAGVTAVLFSTVFDLGRNVLKKNPIQGIAVIIAVFGAVSFLSINVIYVIAVCAACGILYSLFGRKKPC